MKRRKNIALPLVIIGLFLMGFIYDQINPLLFDHDLDYQDYCLIFSTLIFCVLGLFQIYTWTQTNTPPDKKTYNVETIFDGWFNFQPHWVWIYNGVYQLYFLTIPLFFASYGELLQFLFGLAILVLVQCMIFFQWPTRTPKSWRNYQPQNCSEKMLHLTYQMDDDCNCFPSMHCSIAAYFTMTMFTFTGWWIVIPLILVGLSCLYTKQHLFVDVPAGILLGIGAHWLTFSLMFA